MELTGIDKEIDDIMIKFSDDIDSIISEVSSLITRWMIDNDISKTTALNFDIVVDEMLTRAGYYDKINQFIDEDYDKLYPMIQQSFALSGVVMTYTTVDLENIMALKALDKNKFSVLASTAGTSLRESLTKYAISNYDSIDIQNALVDEFQGTNLVRHSKTIADSSISQFHQSVMNIKAEEFPDLVWWYAGPNIDKVTREFCECIQKAKRYYTKAEKLTMERNPKRKYNCRHHFDPVTEEYAIDEKGLKKSNGASCK